jgi:hypothetical protein
MEQVRSLREVFASMSHGSADPAAALAEGGHGDLPGHLVTEAIISYADTAPVAVAEHLAPFVVAHSAVPSAVPGDDLHPDTGSGLHDGFALLASAPVGDHHLDPSDHLDHLDPHLPDQHSVLDDFSHTGQGVHFIDHQPDHAGHDTHATADPHDPHDDHTGAGHTDLWFGHGQAAALAPHLDPQAGDAVQHQEDPTHSHFTTTNDPWFPGHDQAVPEHQPAGDLTGWQEDVDAHHGDAHDVGVHQLPVDDPGSHDLPLEHGH